MNISFFERLKEILIKFKCKCNHIFCCISHSNLECPIN